MSRAQPERVDEGGDVLGSEVRWYRDVEHGGRLARAAVDDHHGAELAAPGQTLARAVRGVHQGPYDPGLVPADLHRRVVHERAGGLHPRVEGLVEDVRQSARG